MGPLVRAINLAVRNMVENIRQFTNSSKLTLEVMVAKNQGSHEMEVVADKKTSPNQVNSN
jgi:hypothetical protein